MMIKQLYFSKFLACSQNAFFGGGDNWNFKNSYSKMSEMSWDKPKFRDVFEYFF